MDGDITVRIFGSLRPFREERGLPVTFDTAITSSGMTGEELAVSLGVPAEKIEGMFVNHTVYGIGHRVYPGDRVAFVPYDTPGPHRVFLGLYRAGKADAEGSS